MRIQYMVTKYMIVVAVILSLWGISHGDENSLTIDKVKANTVKVIKVKNGINSIDLNGDGKRDIVVNGYRGHMTAHSFNVYSFYIYKKIAYDDVTYDWQVVAVGDKGGYSGDDINKYIVSSHQGADCVLKEIRIVKFKGDSSYHLVVANRPFGSSYIDTLKVTFSFYKLIFDKDEDRFIYEKVYDMVSKEKYCDVNESFKKELGY